MAEISIEKMGKRVAEEALDGYVYKGKTLREWIDILAQTQWIPVSKRLPTSEEQYKSFLVTNKYGRVSIETFYLTIKDNKPYFSGTGNVIAWMPLPESYKSESEGENERRKRKGLL